jgi:hypothetical protein
MAEDSEDPFVPIVDEDGRVRGVMDQMTADFLASPQPDPTQASLDAAFDGVSRVRLVGPLRLDLEFIPDDVVRADVSDPASLAELTSALRISEEDEFGHLMSPGLNRLELWVGERHANTLELPEWDTIRWPLVWRGDATLADPRRFADWLLGHGVAEARDYVDEQERRSRVAEEHKAFWERAMPPSLRPLWPDRLSDPDRDLDAARTLLQEAVPDPVPRVRALYAWFGSSPNPFSGYYPYEMVPQALLLEYPIDVLLEAADSDIDATVLGAGRLFSGDFMHIRGSDLALCPEHLRQLMLDVAQRQRDSGDLTWLRKALDLPAP